MISWLRSVCHESCESYLTKMIYPEKEIPHITRYSELWIDVSRSVSTIPAFSLLKFLSALPWVVPYEDVDNTSIRALGSCCPKSF